MIRVAAFMALGCALALNIAAEPVAPTTQPGFVSIETAHLHNAHIVTDKILSGAQPEGEEGFKELAARGVKTILSVDGAKPDVETARKYGLRYVHIPITYATVTEEQGRQLARAMDELQGPIYVHCHHGKHRSAAAVAVACVYNGMLKPEQAESVLKTFGTGANYTGLWKAARDARPMDPQALAQIRVNYVEAAPIPAIAEAMVLIDQYNEHLKLIQKNEWVAPADHPDLDPPHEALQLEEHLRETARLEATAAHPEDFRVMLTQSEKLARELRETLKTAPLDPLIADTKFKQLGTSCVSCHKQYRD